jgi:hypothetical protein
VIAQQCDCGAATKTLDISVEGESKPIGTTPNHPIWSVDREAFVRADSLSVGEQRQTLNGIARVTSITARGPPEPVYNLEVQVKHTYFVADSGVLVHNGNCVNNVDFKSNLQSKSSQGKFVWDRFQRWVAGKKEYRVTGGGESYWADGIEGTTLNDSARVTSITARGPPEPVYNLEVQVKHTYFVADSGVLVHNGGRLPKGNGRHYEPLPNNVIEKNFRSRGFRKYIWTRC